MNIIWIIARNTYRELIRDRVLYGIGLIGALATGASFLLSTISFEQNARVLQDIGLTAISLCLVVICVFVTTTSIHHDVERRALYLLFAKPISRTQYVLGKYVGFLLLLITSLVSLGILFVIGAALTDKSIIVGAIINLSYSFLEISLLSAIALLFATFTSALNATLYTLALFFIGHSLTLMRSFALRSGNTVMHVILSFCYYIFPNLEKFDVRQAVLYGIPIPHTQVAWSLVYWVVYTGLVLVLAIKVMRTQEV